MIGAERWKHSDMHGADAKGKGTWEWVGGVGKTYAALMFVILPYLNKLTLDQRNVIIVMPQVPLIRQWIKAVESIIPSELRHAVHVYTVQDLIAKGTRLKCDLLVVDELHLFYSEERRKYIDGTMIEFKHNLGLTATYKDPKGRHHAIAEMYPIIDKIDTREALQEGYISKFFEYNLGLYLNEKDQETYAKMSFGYDHPTEVNDDGTPVHKKGISDYLAMFGDHGFTAVQKVLSGATVVVEGEEVFYSGYSYACMWAAKMGWHAECSKEINDVWNPNIVIGYAKQTMALVRSRKNIINMNKVKIDAAVELVLKYPQFKTISFSQSTEYADLFAGACRSKGENCVVFHSSMRSKPMVDSNGEYLTYKSGAKKGQPKMFGKTALKKHAIESIANGNARIISTASALNVGFNVEDISMGIIAGRNSNFNDQRQRLYRATRIDPYNTEQPVILVNIYFVGTVDERWLNKAQSQSENLIYWVSSIDEINFNPQIIGATF